MKILTFLFLLIVSSDHPKSILAWDSKQLEVFDVVEEVKVNFYDFLAVPQNAETPAIKAAFRRLSLELHPDKNPASNADEQFRNLVAVYDVLKDSGKRKYYDEVLVNGLPNWRSAVYYYRHVRRIGLLELCLFLFVLISIGQYLVGWASYFERKYTMEQIKGRKQKKIVATIEIQKPSICDTLPLQVPRLIWYTASSTPFLLSLMKQKAIEKWEERKIERIPEDNFEYEPRPVRRRKPGFIVPDGPTFQTASPQVEDNPEVQTVYNQPAPVSGGLWTDDDLSELVQLINRFPGGTPKRWEVIAEALNRSVPEVTYMTNRMKSNPLRLPSQEPEPVEVKEKKKRKGGKIEEVLGLNTGVWSQEQQRAMENALVKYPKGSIDRWDYIAECVPGKSKEECMLRYKYLVELVKQQKQENK